jgi:CheY-like chemotaxis protein
MDVVNPTYRPCMVLACAERTWTQQARRILRRLGWDVYQAEVGPEARRLARMLEPDLILLDCRLPGESGWLTCAKLTRERPGTPVLLLGSRGDPASLRLAAFVQASALLDRDEDPGPALSRWQGPALSA